jgi:predicted dehydrogenase
MMPNTGRVRIGIVGAGANTGAKHIPGFRAIGGVEIVGVCNRSPESTRLAAAELSIPKTYENWHELVEDDGIDAVLIGTWPYVHCEITLAALKARKHVLTEARMCQNAHEAHLMLTASQAHPELITQIVPSPVGLSGDYVMKELISGGVIGDLREVLVRGQVAEYANPQQPLHWRQRKDLSGLNVLALGIYHETLLRWVPGPVSIRAQSQTFIPQRLDLKSKKMSAVTLPDSVQVLTQTENGASGVYLMSGVTHHALSPGFELYGSQGTIIYDVGKDEILAGKADQRSLHPVPIPKEKARTWQVEADFIAAIHGERPIELTTFETGVQYMEFTEAVHRSAVSGTTIELPLKIDDPSPR